MSGSRQGRKAATDGEWALDVEKRIKRLQAPRQVVRLGPNWVIGEIEGEAVLIGSGGRRVVLSTLLSRLEKLEGK